MAPKSWKNGLDIKYHQVKHLVFRVVNPKGYYKHIFR